MPINNLTHFVLIDFENVPGVDLSVLGRHPMAVTLFLGPKSKLKAALVEQITTLPFEVRLIKVGQMKKNALDFVLAYHLGEMAPRYPRGHYYLISKDQDFEPLVAYLREHNLHISQHPDLASLPFLAQPQSVMPVAKAASLTLGATAKPATILVKNELLPPVTVAKPAVHVLKVPPPRPTTVAKPVTLAVKTTPPMPATATKPAMPAVKIEPLAPVVVAKPVKLASVAPIVIARPVVSKKPAVPREDKIVASLKDSKNLGRPTTLKRLQAHIKNNLGKEATQEKVTAIIARMSKANSLIINPAGKVSYK